MADPDLVGQTLIVHPPPLVARMWGLISRLMPAWWGVQIISTLEEVEAQEGICLHE